MECDHDRTAEFAGWYGIFGGVCRLRVARAEQPILTDDGLYKQSWFLESFLELADDHGARRRASALR